MKKIFRKKNSLCKKSEGFSFTETIVSVCLFSIISFSVLLLTRNSFSFVRRIEKMSIKKECALREIRKLQDELSALYIPFYMTSLNISYSEKEFILSDKSCGKTFYSFKFPDGLKLKKAELLCFKNLFVSGISMLLYSDGEEKKIAVHFAEFFPGEIVF